MAYKKPKIGQIVYVVYCNQIYEDKVRYIGEETFLLTHSEYINRDYYEWWFDEYDITRSTTFNKAKEILRKKLGVKRLCLELTSFYKDSDRVWRLKRKE